MKNWIRQNWLLLLVLAAPFVFIGLVWDQIPERMPIHFDADFRANGWGTKPWAPLLLPLTTIVAVTLAKVVFHFDPKMAKCDPDTRAHVKKVLDRFMIVLAVFLGACSVSVIWAAWGNPSAVMLTIGYGIPVLFLILGNILGKLRPNYTIGIRLPWTLESPEVWVKTHRFGGRSLVALSIVMLLAALILTPKGAFVWILLGCMISWSITVGIYSFVLSRKENRNHQPVPSGPS